MKASQFRTLLFALCVGTAAATSAQQTGTTPSAQSVATPATTTTPVVTTGGKNGLIPVFTDTSTVGQSIIYQYNGGIGIGTVPSALFDVNGTSIYRGILDVARTANASPTAGTGSWRFSSQQYNSSAKVNVNTYFQIQAEATGNNTASTGATLNLLYYNGGGPNPAETGFYFNPDGTIHFSAAQTFPSTANGITSVAHDASLTGAGTSASPLGLAAIQTSTVFTGNGTTASPLDIANPATLPGAIYAKGLYSTNYAANNPAVEGDDYSNSGVGVEGLSFNSGTGTTSTGYGMVAEGYYGIYAYGSHYAGDFDGNVYVGGTLAKAGGSFKIDDPVDPENKYLSHSFVESPDMMNIYNGNVVTDSTGTAIVTMPTYFVALNRDFRYQLTIMGEQFAQARIASKMADGTFTIKTDKPDVEVSWQVTGIRQDAWANAHRIPNEEEKSVQEKGHFLHPELFGHAGELSIPRAGLQRVRSSAVPAN